ELHHGSNGYAASKWVADRLFLTAIERGFACNIFRLGLVWADSQKGRYDPRQRENRIFASCLMSGYGIRGYRYDLPPTPVDYVARAIVHISKAHARGQGIFHLSSPDAQVKAVFERCNEIAGTSLNLIPLDEWISEMKRRHRAAVPLPVMPLIEGLAPLQSNGIGFDCTRTNSELREAGILAPDLNDELLQRYVEALRNSRGGDRGCPSPIRAPVGAA